MSSNFKFQFTNTMVVTNQNVYLDKNSQFMHKEQRHSQNKLQFYTLKERGDSLVNSE